MTYQHQSVNSWLFVVTNLPLVIIIIINLSSAQSPCKKNHLINRATRFNSDYDRLKSVPGYRVLGSLELVVQVTRSTDADISTRFTRGSLGTDSAVECGLLVCLPKWQAISPPGWFTQLHIAYEAKGKCSHFCTKEKWNILSCWGECVHTVKDC